MPTTHTPAPPRPATAPAAREPGLAARLAAVDAAMTVRLEHALLRLGVDAAHAETTPQLDAFDARGLAAYAAQRPAPDLWPAYPTPVAALLQRAARRLGRDGWCQGATRSASGARCMYGAIAAEARGDGGLEGDALAVLLDAIRRDLPGAPSVPRANDALAADGGVVAVRLLGTAAELADARGL
ncbi:hypothetical protein [Streptomyces sp. NPDC049879]|uniref:DUF6197 family protein n=1 Tax=Streptomyces sp. NPDC049879 TaxID=3365598 RepID=UPI0037A1664D